MFKDDVKQKIDVLSSELNKHLSDGIKNENYSRVLKLSQELDKLIVIYTKLTLSTKGAV
ncbi:MAG: aspartyl-phosphate phosphatase Spo0E family protein [Clostridiales bacterium]|nr:aspartyl-phosphate phosphatase Spo0E family protein [Clostridiales bacterium]